MFKSLKTIQTIVKIGKILATVVFVCSIVGAVGSLVGLIAFLLGQNLIMAFLEENTVLVESDVIITCFSGIIFSVGECVLAKFAMTYCDHEMEAGTPFTYEGSKEMLRLGILALAIPAASAFLVGVTTIVLSLVFSGEPTDVNSSTSMTLGIALLLASLVFRHGAELSEHAKKLEAEKDAKKEPEAESSEEVVSNVEEAE